ncbi:Ankyrin-3 (ANK-3) (Ankyrin-G) [Durusdinium trenchii]
MWMNGVPPETLPLVKSLEFLQKWLVKLATAKKEAILWAGFWTDPDAEDGHLHRASKETLQRFAHLTETETVHPSTKLGRMIEEFNELDQCKGELAWKLTGNFWSFASYSFVLGMKRKKQGTVIALVNKDLEGPRSLSKSVLFQHEVPTLGIAAWGLGFWSPQVILIDLKATCNKTSSMLRERLFARLSSYFHVKAHRNSFTSTEFALRSRPLWQCLDCEEGKCELGSELATHLRTLRQARKRERNLNQELCNAVHPTYRNWNYWRTNQPPRSVQQLLELNADPSRVFCQGFAEGDDTPLHIAVRGCQADTVRQLLASGTPTEAKNGGDHTPLMLVAHFCNSPEGADIAEQLLQHGANASAFSYDDLVHSTTALHEFTRPNVTFHQIVDKFHRTRPNTAVAEVLKKHLAE